MPPRLHRPPGLGGRRGPRGGGDGPQSSVARSDLPPSSRLRYREYRKMRRLFRRPRRDEQKQEGKGAGPTGDQPKHKFSYYLRRYVGIVLRFRMYLGILLTLGFVSMIFRAILPWTSKFMIDYVLVKGELLLLFGTCVVLLTIAVSDIIISSITDYTSRLLSNKMRIHVRRQMIEHLQAMPLDKLDKLKTGGVISRLEGDANAITDLLYEGFLTPLSALLMFVIAIGSLSLISPLVTLICCVFCGVLFVVAYFVFNGMRPLFRDIREDIAQISGRLAETFGGIRVVRIFGREPYESREFVTAHHTVIRKDLFAAGLSIATHRVFWFIYWCMNIAIWAAGGYMVIRRHAMTVGDLVVFVRFIHWFFQPVFMIMHSLSRLQNSIACAERVFDLLEEEVAMKDPPDALPVRVLEKEIRFEHVSFAYEPDKPVLHDVSFSIPKGKVVALVGPSGAGKSTITNLLVRFYDVDEGRITLDGVDIRRFRLAEYRRLFGLVLQDVFLFDGTIAENISYSKPDASMDEIIAAAKAAFAHDFIEDFPDGYDTIIGERGVRLSGGQKQRISLARAILRDPQVLILDEATSSLDSESEALIQEALREIMKNRTSLVIAHRLSTVMDADNIVVIDKGVIREEGTHLELLARRGRYWEMFTKQMEKARGSAVYLDWSNESPSPAIPNVHEKGGAGA